MSWGNPHDAPASQHRQAETPQPGSVRGPLPTVRLGEHAGAEQAYSQRSDSVLLLLGLQGAGVEAGSEGVGNQGTVGVECCWEVFPMDMNLLNGVGILIILFLGMIAVAVAVWRAIGSIRRSQQRQNKLAQISSNPVGTSTNRL